MVEFPLTHPPTRLFAYVNSYPKGQVMGVVMDERTGRIIETLILPTKQRVMLGLGIADDNAHAHHTYRRLYPHGYRLIWTDDPNADKRLDKIKEDLRDARGPSPSKELQVSASTHSEAPTITGQLTADLVQGGIEKAKSADRSRTRVTDSNGDTDKPTVPPRQPTRDNAEAERGDTPPTKPDLGGFF